MKQELHTLGSQAGAWEPVPSGETVAEDFFKGLEHWRRLTGKAEAPGALVYGGERSYRQRGFTVDAWDQWG